MQVKQLFTDDSAVSPVIGVILMVAITVILAAVIGTFVLGLGSDIQQSAPQATFGFENESGNDDWFVTHETGDTIDQGLSVVYNGGSASDDWGSYPVSSGDQIEITGVNTDTTIRVVWESENGENSATLSSHDTGN